jgi:hypothetical protein
MVLEADRERLSVSKYVTHKLDVDRFNLKKLSKMEVMEEYQLNISNRYAVLENRDDRRHIHKAWENMCWRDHTVLSQRSRRPARKENN